MELEDKVAYSNNNLLSPSQFKQQAIYEHTSNFIEPVSISLKNNAKEQFVPNFRLSDQQIKFLQKETDRLFSEKKISKINSPVNSPVQLVAKQNSWRFTVNYKPAVNDNIENDKHPLPLISERIRDLSQFKFFDKIDLSNGFWNVPMSQDPDSRKWLAFYVPGRGQYTWNVLPQGLKISPSAFQSRMDRILDPLLKHGVKAYMDDITYGADSLENLISIRKKVLQQLQKFNLIINNDKTLFGKEEIEVLGFLIKQNSITPKEEYLIKISEWRSPSSITELRKFLGKVGHIAQNYPGIERLQRRLYPLLKKSNKWFWSYLHENAFSMIKERISKPIPLSGIKTGPITLISDAGDQGFAIQVKQGERYIGHIARRYNPSSISKLSPPLREAYAIKEGLLYFQPLFIGHQINVITDSKVSQMLSAKHEDRNIKLISRIMAEIDQFDVNFIYKPRNDPEITLMDKLGRLDEGYIST